MARTERYRTWCFFHWTKTGYGESVSSKRRTMKRRDWVLLAFIVLFSFCTYRFLTGLLTDVYHGRVVEEEGGTPLAGAAVTVVWYRTPAIQMEGSLYFLSAQETTTDADGRFSLQVSPGLDWDPTTV